MPTSAFRFSGKRRPLAIGLSVVTLTAVIVVVAVMVLGTRTALGSGTGGGAECFGNTGTQPVCSFKDGTAFVDYNTVSSDGCTFTDAQVSLYNNLTVPGRAATHNVSIILSTFDYCGGGSQVDVSDVDPSTGLLTFTGDFQISSDLSTATVTGTADMYDSNSGTQVFTTSVNLTFNGYGPTFKSSDSQHFQAPGYVMNTHFRGTNRSAEVSGTFTDQDGINVAAEPTTNGTLLNSSGGTVQIFKN